MVNELIEQTTELTERQKEILVDAHFSQDFDSLDRKRKESIIKIEMLLTYLEDKYGEEFIYDKFYTNDEGTLVAHARNDRKSRTFQTVLSWDEDKEEYDITDGYEQEVIAADKYEELFKKYMDENYPEVEYFDDIHVMEIDGQEITNDNACVSLKMIMKECYADKADYKTLAENICLWMGNPKYGNALYIMVMPQYGYAEANYYNYGRLGREGKAKYAFVGHVDENGEIKVSERE